jgi:hypothetical protein
MEAPSVWMAGDRLRVSVKNLARSTANPHYRPFRIDFKRQELFEFSLVSVPANPEATIDPAPVAIGASKSVISR